jgi:hypothetical protein
VLGADDVLGPGVVGPLLQPASQPTATAAALTRTVRRVSTP